MPYQDGQGFNLKRDSDPYDLPEEYRKEYPTLDYKAIIQAYFECAIARREKEEK
jgi:hypothetical protein